MIARLLSYVKNLDNVAIVFVALFHKIIIDTQRNDIRSKC